MMPITPDQVKEVALQLLPAVAPLIVEGLKKLAPEIEKRVPWFLKPIVTAVIGALIGLLTDLVAGGGSAIGGMSVALGTSVGYRLAREKPPHA